MKRILLILLPLTLLCGCSGSSLYANSPDIQDLKLVETLGFDAGRDGRVLLSASAGGGEDTTPLRMQGSGRTIPLAIRTLRGRAAQGSLYFAHIQCLAVGEQAAQNGIGELLDWAEREPQLRLDLPLFIVQDGDAAELVTASEDEDYEITSTLLSLKRESELSGTTICYTLTDIAERLARSGAALACSVKMQETGGSVPSSPDSVIAVDTGFAVLRGPKLIGYTGPDAAQGICLLLNRAGAAEMPLPDGAGGTVTAALSGGGTELRAHYDAAGKPWLEAVLDYRCAVLETTGEDLTGRLDALDEAFTAWLHDRAADALGCMRASETDFLELSRLFERSDPALWRSVDWESELPGLRCSIRCKGTVERSFDLGDPAGTSGEADHV